MSEPVAVVKPKKTTAEYVKLYRERNPERWYASLRKYQKKKYTCECGAVLCNALRGTHRKSAKHKERMALIEKIKEECKVAQA
jgi:hypothetical protein